MNTDVLRPGVDVEEQQTPRGLREEVRAGIVDSLRRDFELRGGHTARLLVVAGVVGVVGAVGATLLVAGHPFGHHAPWHVAAFSAVWAGLLVVTLAIVLLQVRTPSLPLARSASVGLIGLGIAGAFGAVCPDPHFLAWWSATRVGDQLAAIGGLATSALCFGLVTALFFGAAAAFLAISTARTGPVRPPLPAGMLLLLLAPGVALQCVGTSWSVLAGWLLGTALGAHTGVAAGIRLRSVLLG
jgi:hypothetical protein